MNNITFFVNPGASVATVKNLNLPPNIKNFILEAFEIKLKTNDNLILVFFVEPLTYNKKYLVINNNIEKYNSIISLGVSNSHADPNILNHTDNYSLNNISIELRQILPDNSLTPFIEHSGVLLEFTLQ